VNTFENSSANINWAASVPMPSTGLMNAAATDVVVALMRGVTATSRSCVSCSRSAVPDIEAMAWLLLNLNSSILPTPFSIVPVPLMASNTIPRLDSERKSSVAKRSRLAGSARRAAARRPGRRSGSGRSRYSVSGDPESVG
jgi:hypothetical protein